MHFDGFRSIAYHNTIGSAYFQAVGKKKSTLLTLSKQGFS
jgi:hypothetical protein